MAGAFAEVRFHFPADPDTLSIPATTLMFGAHGMQVVVVDLLNRVKIKTVTLGRNLGDKDEIASGLTLADQLVDNPPESTQTGASVRVAEESPRPGQTVAAENVD